VENRRSRAAHHPIETAPNSPANEGRRTARSQLYDVPYRRQLNVQENGHSSPADFHNVHRVLCCMHRGYPFSTQIDKQISTFRETVSAAQQH
jgi:hypothetical protein